jgi:hypothetical protein
MFNMGAEGFGGLEELHDYPDDIGLPAASVNADGWDDDKEEGAKMGSKARKKAKAARDKGGGGAVGSSEGRIGVHPSAAPSKQGSAGDDATVGKADGAGTGKEKIGANAKGSKEKKQVKAPQQHVAEAASSTTPTAVASTTSGAAADAATSEGAAATAAKKKKKRKGKGKGVLAARLAAAGGVAIEDVLKSPVSELHHQPSAGAGVAVAGVAVAGSAGDAAESKSRLKKQREKKDAKSKAAAEAPLADDADMNEVRALPLTQSPTLQCVIARTHTHMFIRMQHHFCIPH